MRTPSILRGKLRRLIARERLDDIPQFLAEDAFDEVPLFSRYKDVDYLEDFGRETADRLLLMFGLDALEPLLELGVKSPGLLIALSVDRSEPTDPIVPRVFVSNRTSAAGLVGHLSVRLPRSHLGRWLAKNVENMGESPRFLVLEEHPPVDPGHPRIYIGPRPEFARGLMTIDAFLPTPVASGHRPRRANRRAVEVSGG